MDIINKVLDWLIADNLEFDSVSPNFVAEYAYNRGVKLESWQVVAISDTYKE